MFIFRPHESTIYSLAFSPDGNVIATATASTETTGIITITKLSDSRDSWRLQDKEKYLSAPIVFSSDGRFLAQGGPGGSVWAVNGHEYELIISPGMIFGQDSELWHELPLYHSDSAVAFSPENDVVAIQGPASVLRWSLDSRTELPGRWGGSREENHNQQFATNCLAYSPDGSLLANTFAVINDSGNRYDSVIMLWDAHSGELRGRMMSKFSSAHPQTIAFSTDGNYLAGIYGTMLQIFDVASQKLLHRVKPGTKHFKGLVFTRDGRRLVTVSNDKLVRVWQVPTLIEETVYEWKIGKLTSIAIAHDGLRLAAGSNTGKVLLWDIDL